tara:strand:+ start:15405 stop:17912 length:2508 start_codon:yes stop_codon:yes gene_type:complete
MDKLMGITEYRRPVLENRLPDGFGADAIDAILTARSPVLSSSEFTRFSVTGMTNAVTTSLMVGYFTTAMVQPADAKAALDLLGRQAVCVQCDPDSLLYESGKPSSAIKRELDAIVSEAQECSSPIAFLFTELYNLIALKNNLKEHQLDPVIGNIHAYYEHGDAEGIQKELDVTKALPECKRALELVSDPHGMVFVFSIPKGANEKDRKNYREIFDRFMESQEPRVFPFKSEKAESEKMPGSWASSSVSPEKIITVKKEGINHYVFGCKATSIFSHLRLAEMLYVDILQETCSDVQALVITLGYFPILLCVLQGNVTIDDHKSKKFETINKMSNLLRTPDILKLAFLTAKKRLCDKVTEWTRTSDITGLCKDALELDHIPSQALIKYLNIPRILNELDYPAFEEIFKTITARLTGESCAIHMVSESHTRMAEKQVTRPYEKDFTLSRIPIPTQFRCADFQDCNPLPQHLCRITLQIPCAEIITEYYIKAVFSRRMCSPPQIGIVPFTDVSVMVRCKADELKERATKIKEVWHRCLHNPNSEDFQFALALYNRNQKSATFIAAQKFNGHEHARVGFTFELMKTELEKLRGTKVGITVNLGTTVEAEMPDDKFIQHFITALGILREIKNSTTDSPFPSPYGSGGGVEGDVLQQPTVQEVHLPGGGERGITVANSHWQKKFNISTLKEFCALYVAVQHLGAGYECILTKKLRNENHFTYGAHAWVGVPKKGGEFTVNVQGMWKPDLHRLADEVCSGVLSGWCEDCRLGTGLDDVLQKAGDNWLSNSQDPNFMHSYILLAKTLGCSFSEIGLGIERVEIKDISKVFQPSGYSWGGVTCLS